MTVSVYSGKLCIRVNSSLQKARETVRILDDKIHLHMKLILMSKTESNFADLERDVRCTLTEIESLHDLTEKDISLSYNPERWRSVLGGIDVLLKNIYIVKGHVSRFREFAHINERLNALNTLFLRSAILNEGATKVEHAKLKQEFNYLRDYIFAMISGFAVRPLAPCQKESFERLVGRIESLKSSFD